VAELSDENLLRHNFEWVSSSRHSFGKEVPELRNGIVRIPVHVDDFALYTGELDFDRWQALVLEVVKQADVAVVSLHDCYAHLWLDRYPGFLERVQAVAPLATLDHVAARVTLAAAA
jgi:hypothetical protein